MSYFVKQSWALLHRDWNSWRANWSKSRKPRYPGYWHWSTIYSNWLCITGQFSVCHRMKSTRKNWFRAGWLSGYSASTTLGDASLPLRTPFQISSPHFCFSICASPFFHQCFSDLQSLHSCHFFTTHHTRIKCLPGLLSSKVNGGLMAHHEYEHIHTACA